MIGRLPAAVRQRLDAACRWPQTVTQLRDALGEAFLELDSGPVAEAVTFVHRQTCAVVEAPLDGEGLGARPAVVDGDDARLYLADLLARRETIAEVQDILAQLQHAPPIVLEVFRRGQRLLLPRLLCVVELRGRRELDSLRILEPDRGAASVDAALRLIEDVSAVSHQFGEVRRLGDDRGTLLLLGGSVAAAPVAGGGGFRLLSRGELITRMKTHIAHARDIDAADEIVATWYDCYGRRERVDPLGGAVVTWRLYPLDLDLHRDPSGVHAARCVAENTTG